MHSTSFFLLSVSVSEVTRGAMTKRTEPRRHQSHSGREIQELPRHYTATTGTGPEQERGRGPLTYPLTQFTRNLVRQNVFVFLEQPVFLILRYLRKEARGSCWSSRHFCSFSTLSGQDEIQEDGSNLGNEFNTAAVGCRPVQDEWVLSTMPT